jgi:hypothetical protein
VGEFVNENFVSTHQKVGTFAIVNGQKQGGNVACYFCRPDGTVVHAVAGPVKAEVLLAEARFAVELDKLAQLHGGKSTLKNKLTIAEEHQKRVKLEAKAARGEFDVAALGLGFDDAFFTHFRQLSTQGKVSALLMYKPLARLEDFYPLVWEKVLKQAQNVAPVVVR